MTWLLYVSVIASSREISIVWVFSGRNARMGVTNADINELRDKILHRGERRFFALLDQLLFGRIGKASLQRRAEECLTYVRPISMR